MFWDRRAKNDISWEWLVIHISSRKIGNSNGVSGSSNNKKQIKIGDYYQ